MKRILICTGILGGGTAVVFAAAALASVLAPAGALIPGNFQQGVPVSATLGGPFLNQGGVIISNVGPNGAVTWQRAAISGQLIPGAAGTGVISIANDLPAVAPAPAATAPTATEAP